MKTLLLKISIGFFFSMVLSGISSIAFAQENPSGRDVSFFSWRTTDSNRVSTQNWDKSVIAAFLDRITDGGPINSRVGDFVFEDVDGDGQLELLATVDYSGRAFLNTLFVVSRDSDSFGAQAIDVWNMKSLKGGNQGS